MRFLCRAKSILDTHWVYGYFCKYNDNYYIINKHDAFIQVDPKTVCQYTGLRDENDVMIFEGDILEYTRTKWHEPTSRDNGKDLVDYCEVYYDTDRASFRYRHFDTNKKIIGSGLLFFNDMRAEDNLIEVIGNIHDNPEILNN